MTNSADIEDLRAVVRTALTLPSPLERYRPDPTRRVSHGPVTLVAAGPPGPDSNWALVLGPALPGDVFAIAHEFFGTACPYSIVLEVGTAQAVEDALRAQGWRLDEEEPALALPQLPAEPPAAPPGLEISAVADEPGLADFMRVSETPPGVVPSLAAALDPAVALFVGYVEGQAVATSRLVILDTVADLTGVVTAQAMRRRGYGLALTWAAIAEGVARGCRVATLSASEMGYPLYVRMGFIPVDVHRTYVPPDSAP